jgi:hypothetical protein
MLVAVFGDTHGNLDVMYMLARQFEERTGFLLSWVIQVGDFGFWPTLSEVDRLTVRHANALGVDPIGDFHKYVEDGNRAPYKTLVIRGNHEDQLFLMGHERRLQEEHPEDYFNRYVEVAPNIFYLPDGHVVSLEGTRIAGLGGAFSHKTWRNWDYWDPGRQEETTTKYKETRPGIGQQTVRYKEKRRLTHMTRDRWERLMGEQFDVLLTHDAPAGIGIVGSANAPIPDEEKTEKIYGEFGVPYLRELIETVQPRLVFSGHWHQLRKRQYGNSKATVLGATGTSPVSHDTCMEVVEL